MTSWGIERTDTTTTSGEVSTGNISCASLTVDTTTLHVDADNDRVGIGTTSPSGSLHIAYSGYDDDVPGLLIESTDAGASTAPDIKLYRNSSSPLNSDYLSKISWVGKTDSGANMPYCDIYGQIADVSNAGADGRLVLRNSVDGTMTAVMNIWNNKVGIGTSTPDGELEISSSTANKPDFYITNISSDSQQGPNIRIRNGDTTEQLANGTIYGDIVFQGWNTVGEDWENAAVIRCKKDGPTVGDADMGGELLFYTTQDGSSTIRQKMCIRGNGNVGIGYEFTTPTAQLHIDQYSATGAMPVLRLDQGDVDDSFIDFIGTSDTDGSNSISSDTSTDSAKFGAIRVEINGVTKWIRIYDDHS